MWTPPSTDFIVGFTSGFDTAMGYLASEWPEFAHGGEEQTVIAALEEHRAHMLKLFREGP